MTSVYVTHIPLHQWTKIVVKKRHLIAPIFGNSLSHMSKVSPHFMYMSKYVLIFGLENTYSLIHRPT